MNNEKLENLEIMVAHQEQQISDLNDVVTYQDKQIKAFNARLDRVLGKIERLESSEMGDATPIDRPPHW